jgi:hypothetical protein
MIEAPKHTEADCAYLAALLDLHGRVRVSSEKRNGSIYRTLFLRISGLAPANMAWIIDKFGAGKSGSTSDGLDITYVTRRAAEICVHAYPYLQVFKDHARLVTRFAASLGPNRTPITAENAAIRAEVDRELHALDWGRRGRR